MIGAAETYPLYLGLGSNIGDRRANLQKALDLLDEAFKTHWIALSDIIETEPWGFEADEKFLNAAVRYDMKVPRGTPLRLIAYEILNICKSIEKRMGRAETPEYDDKGNRIYHSRIIDIDILLLADINIEEENLKIPHPRMYEREFVLTTLRQIYPHLI